MGGSLDRGLRLKGLLLVWLLSGCAICQPAIHLDEHRALWVESVGVNCEWRY